MSDLEALKDACDSAYKRMILSEIDDLNELRRMGARVWLFNRESKVFQLAEFDIKNSGRAFKSVILIDDLMIEKAESILSRSKNARSAFRKCARELFDAREDEGKRANQAVADRSGAEPDFWVQSQAGEVISSTHNAWSAGWLFPSDITSKLLGMAATAREKKDKDGEKSILQDLVNFEEKIKNLDVAKFWGRKISGISIKLRLILDGEVTNNFTSNRIAVISATQGAIVRETFKRNRKPPDKPFFITGDGVHLYLDKVRKPKQQERSSDEN